MTIEEAQKVIDQWIKTYGKRYFNELTNMAILTEEVGEVARVMARNYGEQSFKNSDRKVELADELATGRITVEEVMEKYGKQEII